jgi:hypothetical protein
MKRRTTIVAAFVVAAVGGSTAVAHAYYHYTGGFWGTSGQYHSIPLGLETQKLSLVGQTDPSCPNGLALFAVDDFGHVDDAPFNVPWLTVFLLTDAQFVAYPGLPGDPISGSGVPIFSIVRSDNATDRRAEFYGPAESFQADVNFSYSTSLQSGISYAGMSSGALCAYATVQDQFGGFAATIQRTVVHGTLVENQQTGPTLSW